MLYGDRKIHNECNTTIPPSDKIDFKNGETISNTNWKRFVKQWNNFELATGLNEKKMNVRLAIFLYLTGKQGEEKYLKR